MLLTLMCVSHSRGATYQINGAREVQGERRAEVRSSYAESQPSLAVHFFLKCTAKVQNKMLPTKRFLDLVLFVNKYYLCHKTI